MFYIRYAKTGWVAIVATLLMVVFFIIYKKNIVVDDIQANSRLIKPNFNLWIRFERVTGESTGMPLL